jgi:hypothetical protein
MWARHRFLTIAAASSRQSQQDREEKTPPYECDHPQTLAAGGQLTAGSLYQR